MSRTLALLTHFALLFASLLTPAAAQAADDPWLHLPATADGPGSGKTIVLLTAEEEYRSEETFPVMASVLAAQGFDCTVLFAVNRETGLIDPDQIDNIPGLEKLAEADLLVMNMRWRHLPDDQMKQFLDYANSGKPIFAVRTSTHPFNYPGDSTSPYKDNDWQAGPTGGGWGREFTGETWYSHYGGHKFESTRAIPAFGKRNHPLLKGVDDVWGPSDVYGIATDPATIDPILIGLTLDGMEPDAPVRTDLEPVPVAWTRTHVGPTGNETTLVVTTMGAAGDYESEGFRRFFFNAIYYLLDLDVPDDLTTLPEDGYVARPYGFGGHQKDIKPADALKRAMEYTANPKDEGMFYPPLEQKDIDNYERKRRQQTERQPRRSNGPAGPK